MSETFIDIDKLDCMLNKLKALSHPDRISIIELLQTREKVSVGEIQALLNLEQASTSNHLRLLKDHQIVVAKRAGKSKFYSIKYSVMADIIACISSCS